MLELFYKFIKLAFVSVLVMGPIVYLIINYLPFIKPWFLMFNSVLNLLWTHQEMIYLLYTTLSIYVIFLIYNLFIKKV